MAAAVPPTGRVTPPSDDGGESDAAVMARDRARLCARATDEGYLSAKEQALVDARRAAFDRAFDQAFEKALAPAPANGAHV